MRWRVLSIPVLLLVGTTAWAQPQPYPNTFPTLAACTDALRSGQVRFYEPRYFGLREREPADGRERIVVALESDLCLEMLVVGGRRFVAQREGTRFRAYRRTDGSLALYARDDCGNPVYSTVFPVPEVTVREEPPRAVIGPHPPGPIPPPSWVARPAVRREPVKKKRGFCSSTTCKVTVIALGGAAAGYAVWRFWPCPPGTVHR